MPEVPWGMTARAYSPAESMEDSMWMWPSSMPGEMKAPSAEMTFVPSPMQCLASPTSAMRPLWMATSICSQISWVQTLTSFASVMTVSAGTRPIATAESVAEHSQSGTLQNLLLIRFPFRHIWPCKIKSGGAE